MLRVRRHPFAGLLLLAILTPLLAAGPGMPCAGEDMEHHESVGHVVDHDHAAMQMGHHPAMHRDGVTQAPDAEHDAPEPMSCSMCIMCSGTVLTPLLAEIDASHIVRADVAPTTLWVPHLSDLSIPELPTTA